LLQFPSIFREKLAPNGIKFARPWTWQRTAEQVEAFLLHLL